MAWIARTKPLARFVPKIETQPPGKELYAAKVQYHQDHQGFFKYGGLFGTQGVLMPQELLPASAHVTSVHKVLPDIINLGGLGMSERLKRAVEELEPNVHQFKEVPVTYKDGSAVETRYFATIVGQFADVQIDFERTTMKTTIKNGIRVVKVPEKGHDGKVCINRGPSRGWHMWYSGDIYLGLTISDELKRRWDDLRVACEEYVYLAESQLALS